MCYSYLWLLFYLICLLTKFDQKNDRDRVDEALLLSFKECRDKTLKHDSKANSLYCASLVYASGRKFEPLISEEEK